MLNPSRTYQELIDENAALQQRVKRLEHSESAIKRVEEALRASERRLRDIIDKNPIPMAIVSMDGTIEYLNRKSVKTFGYELTEIPDMEHWWKLAYPDEAYRAKVIAQWMSLVEKAIVLGSEIEAQEYRITCSNGTVMTVDVFGILTGDKLFVMFDDITDRKQAENSLLASEQRFKQVTESAGEWIWEIDSHGVYTYASPAIENILGYQPDEVVGKRHFYDFFHPEDREELMLTAFAAFAAKKPFREFINRNTHRDGQTIWLSTSGVPFFDDKGHLCGYRGSDTDITARMLSEQALREGEERYRRIIETSLEGIWTVDAERRLTFVNQRMATMLGYTPEEMLGRSVASFMFEEDLDDYALRGENRRRGVAEVFERHLRRKDGASIWIIVSSSPLFDSQGRFIGAFGMFTDITERKRTEEALRKSEEKYRSLASVADRVFVLDRDCRVLFANENYLNLFGPQGDSIIGKQYGEFHSEERARAVADAVQYVLETGNVFEREHFGVRNGLYFLQKFSPISSSEGGIYAVTVISIDITSLKLAEKVLRESEEKYRSLASTVDGLFLVDRDCRYLSANQAYLDVFGTLKDAVIGKKHSELHDEEADKIFTEAVKYVVETGNSYQDEWFGKKRNKYLIRTFSPVRQSDGSISAVTVVAKDITQRKRAEAKVRNSLKEKELLLGEIHHRVKNNMQVISSILKLQGSASGHREIFENCQQRIRSMALIHENIYKSGKLTRIDLADYTRELARGLICAYALNPEKIDLIIEGKGVTTDMNKAIPCGLVLNELITNALKHAFPNGSAGELRIAIGETENRETQIVIQDNGPGMPEDVDPHQPKGVGLYLVNGLVTNQLGGQWEVARNHGTEVRITFPS